MLTRLRLATLSLLAAASLALVAPGCDRQAAAVDTEFENTVAEATAEGKLVIAVFTADWCGPCKRMQATTWTDQALLAWVDQHAVRVLVDIDKRGALARDYGVRSIPAIVVFDGETELGRVVGMRDAPDMIEFLDSVRSRRTDGTVDDAALAGR